MSTPTSGPSVSSRVHVTLDDGQTVDGVIVEDFSDLGNAVEARIDEDKSVRLRRYAINTDDAGLVFADDDAIEAAD
ncbi:hypothetical protein AAFP35_12295 [Gordonia sp. CPCC 206044]|uniref:hypothetical protein n=1 Tax=Gordonia sp. CPCC 206044 TaxID=3140793 RepID=UPI003AF355BD